MVGIKENERRESMGKNKGRKKKINIMKIESKENNLQSDIETGNIEESINEKWLKKKTKMKTKIIITIKTARNSDKNDWWE